MKTIKFLILMSAFILGTQAQAQDKTIKLLDEAQFQGQQLVHVKAQVNQRLQAQGLDPQNFELAGITLFAKSREGQGKATLIVGQDSNTKNVGKSKSPLGGFGGFFGDFADTAAWLDKGGNTFHMLEWDVRSSPGAQNEVWQIRFNGNIKVDYMQVHLQSSQIQVRINLGDEIYGNGPNSVANKVLLKQSLQAAGYKPNQLRLKAVTLVGKSAQGQGKADLIIANKSQGVRVLAKAPQGNFESNGPASYNRVQWTGLNGTTGAWQIELNGRNKLKAVIVSVQKL